MNVGDPDSALAGGEQPQRRAESEPLLAAFPGTQTRSASAISNLSGLIPFQRYASGPVTRPTPAPKVGLPLPPWDRLRLRSLTFKAVLFASHKLLSRLVAH